MCEPAADWTERAHATEQIAYRPPPEGAGADSHSRPVDVEHILKDLRERAAGLCDGADKSTHPADLADAIRALPLCERDDGG